MVFSEEQQKIFSIAYDAYLQIQELFNSEAKFHDDKENLEACLNIEFCLHKILLEIAASDDEISVEEQQFISSIGNHVEAQNRKSPGYKRFIRYVSVETWKKYQAKYYSDVSIEKAKNYLENQYFQIDATNIWNVIIKHMENIARGLVAIDANEKDEEISCLTKIFSLSVSCTEEKDAEHGSELDKALAELQSLIGLDTVKKEVLSRINMVRVNKIRVENGLQPVKVAMHMVFTGNPGTGKTTVANLIARIYKELGVLSKGQLVEKRRENLVGQYVGQTAPLVEKAIREAKGGILFIDDAYSLSNSQSGNDYGREAIDTLVPLMDNLRDDLIVIVAGYPEKMQEFMNLNEGVGSRFPNWINFVDYNSEEKHKIFCSMVEKNGYVLDIDIEELLMKLWDDSKYILDFGNGRGVRNIYEKIIVNQTNRVICLSNPSKEDLITIKKEDIPRVENNVSSGSVSKIGF